MLRPILIFVVGSLSTMGCCSLANLKALSEVPTMRGQDEGADTTGTHHEPVTPLPFSPTESQSALPNVYLPLTLRDSIEAALADSSVVRVLDGRVNVASIMPTDVLIAEQRIEVERGQFQPRLAASFDGTQTDQPPNAFYGPGIPLTSNRHMANALARITQPLTTGGVTTKCCVWEECFRRRFRYEL